MGSGTSGKGAGKQPKTKSGQLAPSLNKDLIRRANESSNFAEFGDAAAETYARRIDEIRGLEFLTQEEKRSAYTKLHALTENQLKAQGENVSWGVSGRAAYNVQAGRRAADRAMKARSDTETYMNSLIAENRKRGRADRNRRLTAAMADAINRGALEFTFDGETWTRKSKRAKSFVSR